MKYFSISLALSILLSCSSPKKNTALNNEPQKSSSAMPVTFDKQGHRGCRGLMPENTIPAMIHALGMGVTTLQKISRLFYRMSLFLIMRYRHFFLQVLMPADILMLKKKKKNLTTFLK
jgi:hypothetical protein